MCFTHVPQIKRDKLDKKAEAGVFIGYSLISKSYRVFQPDTKKIIIRRDVSLMENDDWSWNNEKDNSCADYQQSINLNQDELVDDSAVHGTRPLADIYQRCNVAILEPDGYLQAEKDLHWMDAMQE